jgi:hypothetical protein
MVDTYPYAFIPEIVKYFIGITLKWYDFGKNGE